jgi:hypothetical protein
MDPHDAVFNIVVCRCVPAVLRAIDEHDADDRADMLLRASRLMFDAGSYLLGLARDPLDDLVADDAPNRHRRQLGKRPRRPKTR